MSNWFFYPITYPDTKFLFSHISKLKIISSLLYTTWDEFNIFTNVNYLTKLADLDQSLS